MFGLKGLIKQQDYIAINIKECNCFGDYFKVWIKPTFWPIDSICNSILETLVCGSAHRWFRFFQAQLPHLIYAEVLWSCTLFCFHEQKENIKSPVDLREKKTEHRETFNVSFYFVQLKVRKPHFSSTMHELINQHVLTITSVVCIWISSSIDWSFRMMHTVIPYNDIERDPELNCSPELHV